MLKKLKLLHAVAATFLAAILLSQSIGCTRTFDTRPPEAEVIPATLYLTLVDSIRKIDATNDSVQWTTPKINYGSSAGSRFIVDSEYYFTSSPTRIVCYYTSTGQPKWSYNFYSIPVTPSPANSQSVIQGNRIFAARTGSLAERARLYCLDRITGTKLWEAMIDSASNLYDYRLNPYPALLDSLVIVAAIGADNLRYLKAFHFETGAEVWRSEKHNPYATKLLVDQQKLYLISGSSASCYDGKTGVRLWDTPMQYPDATIGMTYKDGEKLISVIGAWNGRCKMSVLHENGSLLDTLSLPTTSIFDFSGIAVHNGTLYMTQRNDNTSFRLIARNAGTLAEKWTKLLPCTSVSQGHVIVATDEDLLITSVEHTAVMNDQPMLYYVDFSGNITKKLPVVAHNMTDLVYFKKGVAFERIPSQTLVKP